MRKLTLLITTLFLSVGMAWAQELGVSTNVGNPERQYFITNGNNIKMASNTAPTQNNPGKFAFFKVDGDNAYKIYSIGAGKWVSYDKTNNTNNTRNFATLVDSQDGASEWQVTTVTIKGGAKGFHIVPFNAAGTTSERYWNWNGGVGDNGFYSYDDEQTVGLWRDAATADAGSGWILTEEVEYSLTDMAGNTYEWTSFGTVGVNPTLSGAAGATFEGTWDGNKYTATINFPFHVSKEGVVINATTIASFNADKYWHAVGNDVKVQTNGYDKTNDWLWAIYPKCENGNFSFTIKNLGKNAFVYTTASSSKLNTQGTVVLNSEATGFTVELKDGVTCFKYAQGQYLSINSSGDTDVYLGVHTSTHGGTKCHFSLVKTLFCFTGEGTAASPYIIDSQDALEGLRNNVNAGEAYEGVYFKLTSDIALTEAWTAIGNGSRSSKVYTGNAFKGVFDGGDNTISGLTIASATGNDAAIGLFGVVDGGTVKNLNLTDVNINVASSDLAGAAIGMMLNGATADAITVSGAVVGHDGVGGIVGRLIIDGTIANCTNNASVTSSYGGIGGIVGKAYYEDGANTATFASITNCTNKGTIEAPKYVGGIAGLARANVSDCVNEGAVVGGTQTGGIVGQLMAAGTVSGNENKAMVSGKSHVGGIIGDYSQSGSYTYNNVTIANNVNRGEISATGDCAAILGCNNIDGFTAMTAAGNVSHYHADGLALFGNPEDMTIDATNKFIVPVAQIGTETYYTLAEAAADAQAGDEIVMLADETLAEALTLPAGITFNGNGKQITGILVAAGDITFAGVTKAGDLDFAVGNTVVNIPAGASLQLNGSARMSIGFGTTFNIVGTIADAKTADKATVVPSLVIPGASFSGAGVKFNVTNAYISVPSSYCSSSKSASGTFDFNITNSIWESAGKLAFEEQSVNAKVDFALVNSVLTTGSYLVFGTASGEEGVVIDNSLVNEGTSRQLENCGTMTIKNGSIVNGAVATSSNAKNPGTVIVDNATYAVTGEFSGSDLGTGTLIIKKGATVSAGSITKANITVDAEGMTAGDEINLTANLSKLAGTLSVINNDKLEAKIVDGKVVLAAKPVAKIGEQGYATLEAAFAAATEGQTITMLDDAAPALASQRAITKAAVIDLGGKTLTLTEDDLYFGTTTFKNGTIVVDPSVKPSTAVFWMFANQTLTFDNVKIVATGVTGTYLIGLEGDNSDLNLLNGSEILVENTTALDLDIICVNGTNTCDIKVENSKVNVTNIDGCVFFRGNYTVKDSEVNLAGITKAGFRIEVGQKLSIEGTSKVNIEGEPRDGGIHLTDASANYTKAETATVNATVNEPKVAKIGETTYKTLQAAIEAVQEGETIILVDNVNVTTPAYGQNALNHARAINFTLDLNGKTLSANTGNSVFRFNIANSGATSNVTLTIKNGKIVAGSNTWCAVMASGISSDVKAIMNLENLTIEASKAGDLAVKAWDNATINANNVTVNATNAAGGFYAVGGEIVLDNCTVNQKGLHTAPYLSMAFAVSNNGEMTINSGTYSAEPTAAAEGSNQGSTHGSWVGGVMNSGGELIINGGTFSNGNFGDDALATAARGLIFADTNGKVTVNGGTFNALKSIFDFQNNLGTTSPVITVKGGNYSADPAKVTSYGSIVLDANCVVVENNGVWNVVKAAAKIGTTGYATLAEAVAAVQEGETITILAGTHSEGTIKLPATLKNVTIKGESVARSTEGAVLKDMTISAADGNAYNYEGLTFDGITFDNSRILLTGWRNGDEIIENLAVTNCTFKNLDDNTNSAPIHINKEANEPVNGFTFTNNVIDGATGGSKSGIYAQVTGEVKVENNIINNVSFRPYVIQVTTDDGIADNFTVKGNTFSGSAVGRAQGLGNNAEGTDNVNLVVSNNIFKGITESQQICYWNFNPETTTADLSKNYYDIDIVANPSKIYFNSAAANTADLTSMGVFPIYTELNEDGTINTTSAYYPPVVMMGENGYQSVKDALAAAQAANLTDVEITIIGENTAATADNFDLVYATAFDKVTFKQANDGKAYYFDGLYTGKRNNGGQFVFDGVNLVVTDQYMFEGNVVLSNNSLIKSTAEANCFVYYAEVTVEAGSKIEGVIEDIRGGSLIIDGGKTDGTYSETPGLRDAILVVNWTDSKLVLRNGAYVNINAANEVGRLTVNGTMDVTDSKLDSYQWIAVAGTMNLNTGSIVTTKEVTGAGKIIVDASLAEGAAVTVVKANFAKFTGTIEVTGNDKYTYAVTEEGLVIVERTLAGAGTETSPYLINNVDDLVFFRDKVNSGDTKYNAPGVWVALAADIDLAGTTWTEGIGDGHNWSFDGNFDGQGHTIKNLNIQPYADASGYVCGGLFGYIYGGATIKNLTIENATVEFVGEAGKEYFNVGVLVGFANNNGGKANISDITVKGDIKVNAPNAYGVGAIVGYSYREMGTIENCTVEANAGSYIKGLSFVGGITGYSYTGATIAGCSVKNIAITATKYSVGGIAGITGANNTVSNCVVENVIVNGEANVGNVVGAISADALVVENCTAAEPLVGGNYSDNKPVEARIGNKYYATLTAALVAEGNEVELLVPYVVAADETVELDLNGKTVSMVYDEDATANHTMINNLGDLTIKSSVEGGKLSYTYTGKNLGTTYAANTITSEPGSVLTVKSGTIENLTFDSGVIAYAIDGRTNGGAGDVTVNIEGGVITSKRQAVRIFANSTTNTGALNISGGDFTGRVIVQNASAKANKAALNITGGTFNANEYKSDVLYVGGSSSAEIDINATVSGGTFKGEITETNVAGFISGGTFANPVAAQFCAAGYMPNKNTDGTYGVVEASDMVASFNGFGYATLAEAIAASTPETGWGGEVTLLKDITLEGGYADADEGLRIEKSVTINGAGYTIDCGTFKKGIRIYQNGDQASNVMFKHVNIVNNNYQGRCIDTRSAKINLMLNGGVNLTAHGTNSQPLTIGGSEAMTKVTISGGTIDAGTSGYGVICFVPVTGHINVQSNAVIKGLAAFYLKEGVTKTAIKLSQSTSIGTNTYAAASGDFGAIVIEGSNNTVRLEHNDAVVKAVAADGAEMAAQAAFLLRGDNNTVGYYNNANAKVVTEGGQAYWTLSDADVTGTKYERNGVEMLLEAETRGYQFITVEDALRYAKNGDTVKLLANAELDETYVNEKSLTLDLNGKTLSTAYVAGSTTNHLYAIQNNAELTITDSSDAKEGKISARGNFNYGTLTLEAGTIEAIDGNGGYAVRNYAGSFTMNGGTIATTLEDDHQVDNGGYDATTVRVDEGATFTMNGGELNNICDYTFAIDNYGTTTVKGGKATSVHTTVANYGTINIEGGEFVCNGLEGITAHAVWAAEGTTNISGGTFDGKDNYNGFNVCAEAGANVEITGGTFLPVHSGSLYGEGTITVSAGTFFDKIDDARCVVGFQAVENENGTYTVKETGCRNAMTIVDGEVTEYVNAKDIEVGTLTYKRTLSNTDLKALYVPFEIPVSQLTELGIQVFYINDFRSYNKDGEKDYVLESVLIEEGTLRANHPYLFRYADESKVKNLELVLKNTTLYSTAAEQITVDCTSAYEKFVISGTYTTMSVTDLNGSLILGGGNTWGPMAEGYSLTPFRLFLTMSNRDGSPIKDASTNAISVRLYGADGTTAIDEVEMTLDGENYIYDLQGRRVLEPQKGGLYIVNGKKVIF